MSDDPRTKEITAAHAHEQRGEHEAAARAFIRGGSPEEAVRVLQLANRYGDAASVLLQMTGVRVDQVGQLDPARQRLAQRAAVCFARAGDHRSAVEILVALGEIERAADLLTRAGDAAGAARLRMRAPAAGRAPSSPQSHPHGPASAVAPASAGTPDGPLTPAMAERFEKGGQLDRALQSWVLLKRPADAARVTYALGRFGEAAQLYREAGMAYECAVCLLKAGDRARALDALTQVPRDHVHYRPAVVNAIRLATELRTLGFELDQFAGKFVRTGPKDDGEAEAIYQLARLYESHDHVENASDAYARLVAYRPTFKDAAVRLEDLEETGRGSAMQFERIVREDAAFGSSPAITPRRPSRPSNSGALPELPDLPPRRDVPSAVSPGRAATSAATIAATPSRPERTAPSGTEPGVTGATVGIRGGSVPGGAPREQTATGTVIAERYEVVRKIGQGGMAAVFHVRDRELEEDVALKLFGVQDDPDAQMVARFKQELLLSRQLSHPNVVRLHDIGTHEGRKFITMELLAGTDMSNLIDGPVEIELALRLLVQACAGLQAAHDAGVVHRDIKPENFFVTSDGIVKLMDFGISKRHSAQTGMTMAGFVAGTPIYMSPEQIQNFSSVTHLTDVYALGVMAYEMLHGEPPFQAPELVPLMAMHLTQLPAPLEELHPDLDPELASVVMRMLAKKPQDRPQSCTDVAEALGRVARRLKG